MIGRHLIDDGMSFSFDGAEKLCGESMLLTVADLWETKSMVDDLAILVRRLSNILKNQASKLSNDAMDYIKSMDLITIMTLILIIKQPDSHELLTTPLPTQQNR